MYRLKPREVKREQKFKSEIGLPQMAVLLHGKLRAVILKAGYGLYRWRRERGPVQGERMAGGRNEHEPSPPQLEGQVSFWELGLRGGMGPNDDEGFALDTVGKKARGREGWRAREKNGR